MVAAFPIAKLGALLLKQISKPLANVVKARAKKSVFFRTYICMPPAQFYHWCEVKMKMWSMNLGAPVNIPKLNENMAIELGAELVGEGLVFTIAATVLILEYIRSSRKEAAKEEERLIEIVTIQSELKDLYFTKAKHEAQIRELVRILHVNLPSVEVRLPSTFNQEGIPEHHREGFIEQEKGSLWTSMKGLVWNAIDILLPPVEDSTPQNQDSNKPGTTDKSPQAQSASGTQRLNPDKSSGSQKDGKASMEVATNNTCSDKSKLSPNSSPNAAKS